MFHQFICSANKIKFHRLPSGKIVYDPLEENSKPESNGIAIYGRVSNTKQKDDLIRQMQVLRSHVAANGHVVEYEFSDIASGMNEDRKDFNKMLELCCNGTISTVFITYKDRLTRFGYGYLEKFLELHDCKIVVLNATKEEDFQPGINTGFCLNYSSLLNENVFQPQKDDEAIRG